MSCAHIMDVRVIQVDVPQLQVLLADLVPPSATWQLRKMHATLSARGRLLTRCAAMACMTVLCIDLSMFFDSVNVACAQHS